jgi:hypothetical protein
LTLRLVDDDYEASPRPATRNGRRDAVDVARRVHKRAQRNPWWRPTLDVEGAVSGIHPGYSCKKGRKVEDGLLLEIPVLLLGLALCNPTRTPAL